MRGGGGMYKKWVSLSLNQCGYIGRCLLKRLPATYLTMGLISEAASDNSNLNLHSQPVNWLFLKPWHKLVFEQASSKTEGVAKKGLERGSEAFNL